MPPITSPSKEVFQVSEAGAALPSPRGPASGNNGVRTMVSEQRRNAREGAAMGPIRKRRSKSRATGRTAAKRTPATKPVRPLLLAAADPLVAHPVAEYGFVRLASDDNVSAAVINRIGEAANYPPALIQLNYVLTEAPLLLDNIGLRYLSETLTAYVHQFKPASSVTIAELRTPSLKVGSLITLVKGKV